MEAPQKIKNEITIGPRKLSPEYQYLPENFEIIHSQGYMHSYVHCSICHSGQYMETDVSFG